MSGHEVGAPHPLLLPMGSPAHPLYFDNSKLQWLKCMTDLNMLITYWYLALQVFRGKLGNRCYKGLCSLSETGQWQAPQPESADNVDNVVMWRQSQGWALGSGEQNHGGE